MTTTRCCVHAVLSLGCVYFLERAYCVQPVSISLWPDSSSVCPATEAFTQISLEVHYVMLAFLEVSTITLDKAVAQVVLQVSLHLCRAPSHAHHVQLDVSAIPLVALSARRVQQEEKLCNQLQKTARHVDLACISQPIRPCVRSVAVASTKSAGGRRNVTSARRITTVLVQM